MIIINTEDSIKKFVKKFMENQNKRLYDILKLNYQYETFNTNCMKKINIQKSKADEIFISFLYSYNRGRQNFCDKYFKLIYIEPN